MKKILIVAVAFTVTASGCKGPAEPGIDKVAAIDYNAEIALDEPVGNSGVKTQAFVLPPQEAQDKPNPENSITKKVTKEGEISFKTADIVETRKAIYTSLEKLGGYVAEEGEANDGEYGQKQFTLKIRIPAKNFDLFLNNVSANAESIDEKSIRIKDVTNEYIDLTTRLSNKKKLEERYLELLKKGSKISDLLEIENKLTEIRSEIESTQGQLNYLTKQVEYSSLDITFYSRQTVKDNGQSFGYKVKTALMDGWQILVNLFFGVLTWWPFWLVLFGGVYLSKKWLRKRRAER